MLLRLFLILLLLCPSPAWAARQFNGTSDDLQSASTVDLTAYSKLGIAFWAWFDSYANANDITIESSASWSANPGAFLVMADLNSGGGLFLVASSGAAGAQNGVSLARASTSAWHHYIVLIDRTQSQAVTKVYVDGSSVALTTQFTDALTGNFGNLTLNVMSRNNASLFQAGRMADLAIWTTLLPTLTDASDLATGAKLPNDPNLSAGAARYYWKLCGTVSPESPKVGSVNLTVNGAAQVSHPPTVAPSCKGLSIASQKTLTIGSQKSVTINAP